MAQAPVMPVFTDALIGDTAHLSMEEFGAYMMILIATWRNNGKALPDDDRRMAQLCRFSVTKWRRKLRPILIQFFTVSESGWHQQRLEKEWNRVSRWLDSQQAKGQAGGKQSASRRASRKQANHKPYKEEDSLPSAVPVAARAFAPGPAIARATEEQSQESNNATRNTGWRQIFDAARNELPWIEPGKA